jgi:alpha-L-fucosidase
MSQRFLDIIRQNLPDCIVNNRIGNGLGDYDTPELFIPRKKIGKAWTRQPGSYDDFEVAMTLNEHWGFDKNDHKWKDARTVVRHLAEAVSRGGNYLLNVGPTAAGAFPPEAKRILGKVGAWMKENGESIHGASAGPFSILPWGVCTAKPGRLYLHVFDRPVDGRLLVPGLGNELRRAYQLAGGNQAVLNAQRFGRDDWIVQLPAKATDPLHPVVVLEIEGLPQVDPSIVVYPPLAMLPASTARIDGSKIKYAPLYMTNRHHDYISEWTEISDFVEWQVRIAQEGVYNVEAVIGADVACEGNQFTLEVGDGKLEGLVASTGGYKNFQTVKLGTIGIPARGPCTLTVKPVMIKPGTSLMNLHALILKPSGAQSVEM